MALFPRFSILLGTKTHSPTPPPYITLLHSLDFVGFRPGEIGRSLVEAGPVPLSCCMLWVPSDGLGRGWLQQGKTNLSSGSLTLVVPPLLLLLLFLQQHRVDTSSSTETLKDKLFREKNVPGRSLHNFAHF